MDKMLLGQWRHQLILREAIGKLGRSVELGTALSTDGIEQDDDGVTVKLQKSAAHKVISEETARFKFVVGADGAHSEFHFLKGSRIRRAHSYQVV